MEPVVVYAVKTPRQQHTFLQLPWRLHRRDPNWIPPLRQNQRELVGFARHPFYQINQAQAFLAYRGNRPCGRILAILNRVHNQRYQERRGFFGFFESVNDPEVARALLDAVRRWHREHQMEWIRGPVNPSMNYECGLLVEGFDSPPTFMMTYNPPYYAELLEQCGLVKAQDMYAFWGHVRMLQSLDKKLDFVVQEATRRFHVRLRRMDRARFHQEVRTFLKLYNQSLGGTWGFTPMSEGEIEHMSRALKYLIVPEMTSVAEVDGRPVGASFALLDYNPRIKQIDGRLLPIGFLRLLGNKRAIKRIRILSTNVLPEYQRWGLGLVILSRLVPDVLEWGIQEAEFSWVLESNYLSYGTLKRGGAIITKRYRIYDGKVDPP